MKSHALLSAALLPIALWAGCFQQTGPEDPSPVPVPALVSVTVQYRQPNGCTNVTTNCADRVVFFGSWMPTGQYVFLTQVPDTFVWTGTIPGVPVNFPPADQPYLVYIYDPHLRDTPTGGVTANRLLVGGQAPNQFYAYGTPNEQALIYIDAVGVGHNPP